MIGVFDSGYGGLTILKQLRETLPEYDFMYLGDNARAPYGPRSFDVVYEFTRQAVMKLFSLGCHLVILACNTASAKALRTIQQEDLKRECNLPSGTGTTTLEGQGYRVLGVIRPTVEIIGNLTKTRHIGIVATEGTIRSESYELEIGKLYPDITVTGQACPLWAAIVEAGEADSLGAEYFVKKRINQLLTKDSLIDTIILGCTHYPYLMNEFIKYASKDIFIDPANIFTEYIKADLSANNMLNTSLAKGKETFYVSANPREFVKNAEIFYKINSEPKLIK
jgi:glutamate racemase